ncbi:MAG TPA: hypothetical protein VJU82_17290, partial [Acidobacteriaceae bacterium]|nr:hypothetical protein [Acidobacteriaceae bacterium]
GVPLLRPGPRGGIPPPPPPLSRVFVENRVRNTSGELVTCRGNDTRDNGWDGKDLGGEGLSPVER